MHSHAIRKALLGVAVVVAVVMSVAVPASAGTVDATISSGILRTHADPYVDFLIPSEGEDPCSEPLPDPTLEFDFDGDAMSGTWEIPYLSNSNPPPAATPQSIKRRFQLPFSTSWYQLDMAFLTGQGTYVAAGGGVYDMVSTGAHVTVEFKIYALEGPECVKDVLLCTTRARLVVGPVSMVTSGSMPNPVLGDQILINATSNAPGGIPLTSVGQCDTFFASFTGDHISLVDLAFSVD